MNVTLSWKYLKVFLITLYVYFRENLDSANKSQDDVLKTSGYIDMSIKLFQKVGNDE